MFFITHCREIQGNWAGQVRLQVLLWHLIFDDGDHDDHHHYDGDDNEDDDHRFFDLRSVGQSSHPVSPAKHHLWG